MTPFRKIELETGEPSLGPGENLPGPKKLSQQKPRPFDSASAQVPAAVEMVLNPKEK
ncbi:hypothetical protein GW756_01670 [bacterium]|nr:hypothetical protein [bacterium]NCQ55063.1 hypothetical protein [Candidatus Parcubacteria bacterium]NCS67107.1 hypothetical protein [Candidatus Peregrinibacteria bacterium]NCS96053.1 hypothetical protein [bacterium]